MLPTPRAGGLGRRRHQKCLDHLVVVDTSRYHEVDKTDGASQLLSGLLSDSTPGRLDQRGRREYLSLLLQAVQLLCRKSPHWAAGSHEQALDEGFYGGISGSKYLYTRDHSTQVGDSHREKGRIQNSLTHGQFAHLYTPTLRTHTQYPMPNI